MYNPLILVSTLDFYRGTELGKSLSLLETVPLILHDRPAES